MDIDTPRPAPTLDERRLLIEERRLTIEEGRLEMERRKSLSDAEVMFELELAMATKLAQSPFLPEKVGRNPAERIAAAWGVMRYANMLGVDAYVLAQQIFVVQGRVGFSTAFLISLVNVRAKLTKEIDWEFGGTDGAPVVTCTATDAKGTERRVTITWAQVQKWGWASKPGEPWKADPVLMMQYRSAAKLIRLYFAGAVMGLTMTAEELRDLPSDSVEVRNAPRLVQPAVEGAAPTRMRAAPLPAEEDAYAAAEREAELVTARGGAAAVDAQAEPAVEFPLHVEAWLAEFSATENVPSQKVLDFLRSTGVKLETLTEKGIANLRLKLGAGGSGRTAFDAFLRGEPAPAK